VDAEELETSGPVVEARSGRRLTPAELDAYARSAWLAVEGSDIANCSLKLDWMLRYRMMVPDFEQKEMAEDRYAEICGKVRRD
jgi:hypothetical protein